MPTRNWKDTGDLLYHRLDILNDGKPLQERQEKLKLRCPQAILALPSQDGIGDLERPDRGDKNWITFKRQQDFVGICAGLVRETPRERDGSIEDHLAQKRRP